MSDLVWSFDTKNFSVRLECRPEDWPDLSWDETGETQAKIESGEWGNYVFSVRVLYKGTELAADYLGNSIYADPKDFRDHLGLAAKSRADGCNYGSYFTDMVRTAIAEARQEAERLRSIPLREAS